VPQGCGQVTDQAATVRDHTYQQTWDRKLRDSTGCSATDDAHSIASAESTFFNRLSQLAFPRPQLTTGPAYSCRPGRASSRLMIRHRAFVDLRRPSRTYLDLRM
jgi:hypothetical protein